MKDQFSRPMQRFRQRVQMSRLPLACCEGDAYLVDPVAVWGQGVVSAGDDDGRRAAVSGLVEDPAGKLHIDSRVVRAEDQNHRDWDRSKRFCDVGVAVIGESGHYQQSRPAAWNCSHGRDVPPRTQPTIPGQLSARATRARASTGARAPGACAATNVRLVLE